MNIRTRSLRGSGREGRTDRFRFRGTTACPWGRGAPPCLSRGRPDAGGRAEAAAARASTAGTAPRTQAPRAGRLGPSPRVRGTPWAVAPGSVRSPGRRNAGRCCAPPMRSPLTVPRQSNGAARAAGQVSAGRADGEAPSTGSFAPRGVFSRGFSRAHWQHGEQRGAERRGRHRVGCA